jgi:GNAT superfamily N-acetyltransferase
LERILSNLTFAIMVREVRSVTQHREIRVRLAGTRDRRAFAEIDPRVTNDLHRREVIDSAMASRQCLVAERLGHPVGYGIFSQNFFERDFVDLLIVSEGARRAGIGTAILHAIEQNCAADRLFTSTNESNVPMRALLEKCGYEPSGHIENLDPADPELVFVKFLEKRSTRG